MTYKDPTKRKEYHKVRSAIHYQQNRKEIIARKGLRAKELRTFVDEIKATKMCGICGESHPATLDFHHRDTTSKRFNLANAASKGACKERILEEIEKCDVFCSNCHRKKHYGKKWERLYSGVG